MPIVKMDRLTVVGLTNDREAVVDALMRVRAVQLTPPDPALAVAAAGEWDDEQVAPAAVPTTADETIPVRQSRLARMIEIANKLHPPVKKPLFKSKRSVDSSQFLLAGRREEEIMARVSAFERNQTVISELHSKIARLEVLRSVLQPWQKADFDPQQPQTRSAAFFAGSLPSAAALSQLQELAREEAPASAVQIVAESEGQLHILAAAWHPQADAYLNILRKVGFNPLPATGMSGSAAEQFAEVCRLGEEAERQIAALEAENNRLADPPADFEMLYDFLQMTADRQDAVDHLTRTRSTFVLEGWIPAHLTRSVTDSLKSRFMVATSARPAANDEDHPILLRNHPLVKPFEVIVEMFSSPNAREVDPTPVLAPFYFFFFGLMLSDIGYGALLSVVAGLIVWKFKAGGEMNHLMRLMFICGISGLLWGVLFGGLFGDLVSAASAKRLSFPVLWFDPMKEPTRLLIWSMVFGIVHLFAAMGMQIYLLARSGKWIDALLDIVPWYFIIAGLGMLLGGIEPEAGKWMAIGGAGIVLLFAGREKRNPFLRLFKGLGALYGITGYFGDILSYTRALALVLATSVIAMVINLLVFGQGGLTVLSGILFLTAGVAGHVLNLALSGLSAYVHTGRLHYVEFFSKFYEGGGQAWQPLAIRTRYIEPVRETAAAKPGALAATGDSASKP